MASTPDKLKQEPPQDDVQMHSDDDTEQEQGNNSGLSKQTDDSQPSQKSPQSNQSNRRILPFNRIKSHIAKVE
ncbi:hypothetical protein QWA68_016957, partial [Fusarium oxysporum]